MTTKLKKDFLVSNIEEKFIQESIKNNLRVDGRSNFDYRKIKIHFENNGHSFVEIGKTKTMGVITFEIVEPYPERPTEGFIQFNTELSPMASEQYDTQRRSEKSIEISRIIERSLRGSKSIDTEALCIIAHKKVWSIKVDVHLIDDYGNIMDACHLAAISALLHFKRPDVTIKGEEYIIHSIEERNAVPLSIHHIPICISFSFFENGTEFVVDPNLKEFSIASGDMTMAMNTQSEVCGIQKGGGVAVDSNLILQCTKIASNKSKEITLILKEAIKKSEEEEKEKKLPEYAKKNSKHKAMVSQVEDEILLSSDDEDKMEQEALDFQNETKNLILSKKNEKKKNEKLIEMNDDLMNEEDENFQKVEKIETIIKKKKKKSKKNQQNIKDLSSAIKKK
eukprot:gene731-8983_t